MTAKQEYWDGSMFIFTINVNTRLTNYQPINTEILGVDIYLVFVGIELQHNYSKEDHGGSYTSTEK